MKVGYCIFGLLILGISALVFMHSRPHYELVRTMGGDILLNTQTGETWKYYYNSDTKPREGFSPIPHVQPLLVLDLQPITNSITQP